MDKTNKNEVMDLINKIDIYLMSSYKEDRQIHTRPMAVVRKKNSNDPCVYFYFRRTSQVSREIEEKKDVYLSYMDEKSHLYVSFKGVGQIKQDENLKRELWTPMIKNWFPEGLDDPELTLVEVRLQEAYIWDATSSREVRLDEEVSNIHSTQQADGQIDQAGR